MLALSVYQPYAERIAAGVKRFEYRSRVTRHRGPVLICATKRPKSGSLPTGVAVCVVEITGCKWESFMRCYQYRLQYPTRVRPFAVKGSRGWFHVDDALIRKNLK